MRTYTTGWQPVNSSDMVRIRYAEKREDGEEYARDPERREIHIEFKSAKGDFFYCYKGVERGLYETAVGMDRPGKFLRDNLITHPKKYPYMRMMNGAWLKVQPGGRTYEIEELFAGVGYREEVHDGEKHTVEVVDGFGQPAQDQG